MQQGRCNIGHTHRDGYARCCICPVLNKEEYLQTVNSEVGYVYVSFISRQLYFHHSLAARFMIQ